MRYFENDHHIEADAGRAVTNGAIIATVVYLGKFDSVSNWGDCDLPLEEEE